MPPRGKPGPVALATGLFLLIAVGFIGLTIARIVKRDAPAPVARPPEAPTLPHRPSPLAARADWITGAGADAVLLDPRAPAAYREGHAPGAVSAPCDSLAASRDLPAALGRLGLTGSETIVIACDTASFGEAGRLFWLLETAGAESVHVLDGGLEAWVASGRSLVVGESIPGAATWGRRPDPSRVARTPYVSDNYGLTGIEVLDARGETIWGRPEVVSPEQWGRAGHIPHSLPIEPRDLLGQHALFLDVASMLSVLVKSGPRPATPLDANSEFVVYDDGASGAAPLLYMLLRMAGIDRMRIDTDGWAGWAADSTLPVVRMVGIDEVDRLVTAEAGAGESDTPMRSVVFLDVRNDSDHARGRIPGSLCLPSHVFGDSLDLFLERNYPGIDRARTPLLAYCYGPDCIRSRNCATLAARDGFRTLLWYRGGMEEWENARRRVVKNEDAG